MPFVPLKLTQTQEQYIHTVHIRDSENMGFNVQPLDQSTLVSTSDYFLELNLLLVFVIKIV